MGLWYECGDGLVKVSWARSDLQCDAYLICPGPSLKNVDANVFNEAGVMTFGINTAYPWIRPDYWFGMDDPSCYSSRVWWEPFIKVTRMYLENDVDLTISGDCSEFCVNVKTLDPSDHRSSAASSRPSKKMANCDRVRFQF